MKAKYFQILNINFFHRLIFPNIAYFLMNDIACAIHQKYCFINLEQNFTMGNTFKNKVLGVSNTAYFEGNLLRVF